MFQNATSKDANLEYEPVRGIAPLLSQTQLNHFPSRAGGEFI